MLSITVTFVGRKSGAIGIMYTIKDTFIGETYQDVVYDMYKRYEHIRILGTDHAGFYQWCINNNWIVRRQTC